MIIRTAAVAALLSVLLTGCATPGTESRMDILRLNAAAMDAYHGQRWDEALPLYEQLVEADPGRALAWYRLGNLQVREGRLDKAIQSYSESLRLEPENAEARHNLGLVQIRRGAQHLREARRTLDRPQVVMESDRYLSHLLVDLVQTVDITVSCDD
ncbi:MAG: tetratricopeptide repeat protein [Ectothiorhodospiraceae bacterium]|nr:tetratricopeptide repeat protein [Ectothiorhodospiraceae bacterium]